MDTVASLLNASTYHKLFSHLPLQQPCTSLCGYNSSKITMLGVFHVPVHYRSKHLPSFPFYISEQGANLLGLEREASLLGNMAYYLICLSKMALFWSEPHQGVRRLGSATFPLSDGSRWHAIRLQKVPIPLTPTRGHWATEPNASAAQRVNSPLP